MDNEILFGITEADAKAYRAARMAPMSPTWEMLQPEQKDIWLRQLASVRRKAKEQRQALAAKIAIAAAPNYVNQGGANLASYALAAADKILE